jgi:hypothetical protein
LGNSCISIFSNEPKPTTLRKQTFGVNFTVLSIFEEKFEIGCHIECFQGIFPKKLSRKVNSQIRHYLNKCNFKYIVFATLNIYGSFKIIIKNWEIPFTSFKNFGDFQNGLKTDFSTISQWILHIFAFCAMISAYILIEHYPQTIFLTDSR